MKLSPPSNSRTLPSPQKEALYLWVFPFLHPIPVHHQTFCPYGFACSKHERSHIILDLLFCLLSLSMFSMLIHIVPFISTSFLFMADGWVIFIALSETICPSKQRRAHLTSHGSFCKMSLRIVWPTGPNSVSTYSMIHRSGLVHELTATQLHKYGQWQVLRNVYVQFNITTASKCLILYFTEVPI